ncbi:hypothetical protein [Streptomonospora salina]|uniref:Ig-like domain-containing protein n=1 Tax=Streptomonospora salina TaxID=104205 RepID=A0A841EDP6_9ACTN|nr:hypothetical protein [Streptomonospora salina]MBB6000514.1 hypothetical protein [Streptomonospora salina]
MDPNTPRWGRFAACTAAAALLATGFASAPAYADDDTRHCVITLDAVAPGETSSEVVDRDCAPGEEGRRLQRAATASTLIMTWYQDRNYAGDTADIRKSGGPCDSRGYGISDVGFLWHDEISSFKTWNGCTVTRAYEHSDYGGHFGHYGSDRVVYVGDHINDAISSFRTWNG